MEIFIYIIQRFWCYGIHTTYYVECYLRALDVFIFLKKIICFQNVPSCQLIMHALKGLFPLFY